ncbi:MAG: TolC family protein [Phycisphaerae bacterium]|nr:TolC family protein [Phycisphaerae bacterium]
MKQTASGRFLCASRPMLAAALLCALPSCLLSGASFEQGVPIVPAVRGGVTSAVIDTDAVVARAALAAQEELAATEPAPSGPEQEVVIQDMDRLKQYVPDPVEAEISDIARPQRVLLSLRDAVALAAAHSFRIRTQGFGPAISAMDVLAAEAVFDASYFLEGEYTKQNQPTPSQLIGSSVEQHTMTTGITKPLPTGAAITGAWNLVRYDTSLSYYTLNPSYTSSFALELRQPLLRGFGLDVNRANIELAENNTLIAKFDLEQAAREQLSNVEKTYWQLVQARRNVVIQKSLVDQTEETLDFLEKRKMFDVYAVQITRTQALLGTRQAEYVQIKNRVRDLEDQLKQLINYPDLNLGEDIEIVPVDFPTVGPIAMDRIAQVQVALQNRSEIEQRKLTIENARINVAVRKNQALPKLDLTARYTINGLAGNPGNAFDEMSTSHFQDYFVGISFEYPIGNRAARAEQRKAVLQRDQAIAALKEVIEGVILEVDVAVRELQTSYDQIPPTSASVVAAEENLDAIVARRVRLSPEYLDLQLRAQETLAQARQALLAALVNHNVALVELERTKGTLLQHYNVSLCPELE